MTKLEAGRYEHRGFVIQKTRDGGWRILSRVGVVVSWVHTLRDAGVRIDFCYEAWENGRRTRAEFAAAIEQEKNSPAP